MAKKQAVPHRPTRLLERGRGESGANPKSKPMAKDGDMCKSPHIAEGFAGGECYPGNNDFYSLGMKNKSPKVSGNIRLSKAFAERREDDGVYHGPFGSMVTRPDQFNKEGAARKERDSHKVESKGYDHRGYEEE